MDSNSGSESPRSFTWGVIAGLLVLLGVGGAYFSGAFNGTPLDPTAQEDVAEEASESTSVASDTEETAQADAATDTDTAAAEAPTEEADETAEPAENVAEVTPPVLDQIFVEPDGNAVLSGNAEPGAKVRVLLGGEAVHSFTVDDSGQFAEFVSIPFSTAARGLTLETDGVDQPVRSDDYLIAALPEPEPEVASVDTAETTAADESAGGNETEAGQVAQTDDTSSEETTDSTQGQQVAILRSGEDGVELVQPATPQSTEPDQVALDTIGYSDTGEVELTGRVADGSAVRVYLDNQLVADMQPTDDGKWRSEIEGIDPGVYTLRVDEVASDGTVKSRLETPFKREPLEVLSVAEVDDGPAPSQETPAIRSVTVQKGDTLWAISRERFGDGVLYVKLFEANRGAIRDPDLIYPGQVFTIPE
ncbi:LysM peptidoglycan-binding domain-containing protein [Ruegeria faecimaris]|uniref:Nucleoid-associated protein YgaU, contains BON and LysM domains n=1 Tax=Ruegeria faecimaris TaxID=686389 RepID=A0A521AJ97_9RHOB|nr:LysM peptidoglycan-binding domain-containing protein [Ruegeria faecimaris]SMO34831.1 Nucleoid-associated protein YgaU, contains BON and LysM domains [Ruegeria faecimaris]